VDGPQEGRRATNVRNDGGYTEALKVEETTRPGYVNRNDQTVVRSTPLPGNDHMQYIYVLRCGKCRNEYGANGSDIFQRKCPLCQGGAPGLDF
jgi:hypothetical protein